MKKIYLIYVKLPPYIYLDRICHLVANTEFRFRQKGKHILGLYAWTSDKKLLQEFMNTRYSPIFKVKTVKSKDIDEIIPKDMVSSIKLAKYKFYHDINLDPEFTDMQLDDELIAMAEDEAEVIVSTSEEHNNCTWALSENMMEFGPASKISKDLDYTMFNDKIEDALDVLGYVTNYDMLYSSEAGEIADYNMGFGLSYRGHRIRDNIFCNMNHNQYYAFMYLYSYLILGDTI